MRLRDLGGGRAVVTEVLIGLNVLALIGCLATGGSIGGGGGSLSRNGYLLGYGVDYTQIGPGRLQVEELGVAVGQWYRIVTGGFLHVGLLHLAMNMVLLYLIGSQLESLLGRARYLSLYIACLVAGSFGVLLVSPTVPTVGASGAVFGLMGAAVVAQRRAGIDVWRSGIGGLVLINVLLTFATPGISKGAHIAGLIGGVAIGALVLALDRAVKLPWVGTLVCAAITLTLMAGCVWAANSYAHPILGF
jgi:membrane associated rhomboid family serine protease